jgi:hypothetical protein
MTATTSSFTMMGTTTSLLLALSHAMWFGNASTLFTTWIVLCVAA